MRIIFVVLALLGLSPSPLPAAATPAATPKPSPARRQGTRNDQIYPPDAAAKPFINFDGKGFIINGERTFLSSGSIHYPRVPHELWGDRLLRMEQANFNCVQSYAFWNLSEPRENVYNFTGDADIGAFYSEAQAHGLYGIARVGPYVCAEWDFGGWPIWLKTKPEMKVRTDDPAYLALNDHWYAKIFSVLTPHQINRGGNILMFQLENEHPLGWGVVEDQPYFVHLKETAVKDGVQVPFFMSGLHHGGPPGSENVDPSKRTNPWFTTEFWSGWFDAYRTLANKRAWNIDRTQWAIVAHGGGGYNFYMIHGGTDFETWNDDSVGASYDYGTAIGQTGDLRLMYYRMKRVNQLAQSFPEIFADSTDALAENRDFAKGPGVQVLGARHSGAGTFVFLQNNNSTATTGTYANGRTLEMTRFGTYPIPSDVTLAEGMKLASSTLPVLARARNGDTTTLVIYGQPGEHGLLRLAFDGAKVDISSTPGLTAENMIAEGAQVDVTIPAQGVEEMKFSLKSGKLLRLLAMNKDLTLYTWMLGKPGKQRVVCGPAFVRDLQVEGGKPGLVVERPYGKPLPAQVAIYGDGTQEWHLAGQADPSVEAQPAPVLTGWERYACPQAAPAYDDSRAALTPQPEELGAHGNNSAFGWYRTSFTAPAAGKAVLRYKVADDAQVMLNGVPVPSTGSSAELQVTAGKNVLAIAVAHHGRNKVFGYMGSLVHAGDKGLLSAPVLEMGGQKQELTGWRLIGGAGAEPEAITQWALEAAGTGGAAGEGLPAFYRAHFTAKPPGSLGAYPILRATIAGLSRGTMWLNGHSLGQYPERIRIDSLYLPECWLKPDGNNTLAIYDLKGNKPEQVRIVIEKPASRELVRISTPVDAATPLDVPVEELPRDLVAANKGNLAFGKPTTASATKGGTFQPGNATDGDNDTMWAAPGQLKDAWLQVDLGTATPVKVVEILWESAARNYKYALEGSDDGRQWRKLGDATTAVPTSPDSPSELSRLNLPGERVRYLRVMIPDTGKGLGIAEVRAYGEAR